jgi:flagellar basal-body rod modification protein FlgD
MTSSSSALGKDAFLKLLVAQISHQDPLKPMDDTAFVAQLAQFSSLEQMMGVNTRLDSLASQQSGTTNASLASMVGKSITLDGSTLALDGTQASAPVTFTLGGDAKSVDISIADPSGKTVRTMHVDSTKAGLVNAQWDGKSDAGARQPAGTYSISVLAKNQTGTAINVQQETSGTLQAIDLADGKATLVLDNGVSAPSSALLRINAGTK